MRIGAAIVILGWGVFLAFWLVLLIAAPFGPARLNDWLVLLVPAAGMAVTFVAATFWRREQRLLGGIGLAASILALLWMFTGMLNVVLLLNSQAPS